MKMRLLTTAVLALAGLGLTVKPASAAAVSYSNDDLFLGFYASGGTGSSFDYLVNIGQASIYRDATGAFALNIGDIGADLSATYGSDWNTRSDLYWAFLAAPIRLRLARILLARPMRRRRKRPSALQ